MKILVKQAGKQVQRMRNILVVLAMLVCTSICLGDTIIISEDIVDQDKVRKLEQQKQELEKQLEPQQRQQKVLQKQRQELESRVESLQKQLPLLRMRPRPRPHPQQQLLEELQLASVEQQLQKMQDMQQHMLQKQPQHMQKLENLLQFQQKLQDMQQQRSLTENEEQQLWYLRQLLLLMQELPQLQTQRRHLQQQLHPLLEPVQKLEKQLEKQKQELESVKEYSDIAGNGNPNKDPDKYKYGKALTDSDGNAIWKDPNNNHLFINPGVKVGDAFGAKMNKASIVKNKGNKDFLSMTNNEVIVSGGEFGCGNTYGNIAGAWADYDIDVDMNISSNTVIITGGSKIGNVYGGRTKYGTVSSSTVRIEGGTVQNVYGGRIVENGTAIENKVNLSDVDVTRDVFGAWIGNDEIIFGVEAEKVGEYGLASSNTVTITSGTVGQNVYGGYIANNGTATLNTVNLTSVTVVGALDGDGDVYGAWIGDGLASSNTVTITSGTVGHNVYGGYIFRNGTATLNKVNLTGVTVRLDVCGAWIEDEGVGAGDEYEYGLASSNEVTITSGTVGRNVYGGYILHNGTATLNKVNLTSVTVRMDVYGAKIVNDERVEVEAEKVVGDGLASSNTVTITSGTVGWNVYGVDIVKNGTATENKVNLSDVDVTRDIYGARIGKDGDAISNEVTITGGRVGGYVLGGYVYNDGTATGNKVTLTNVDVTRDVYGAMVGTDKKAEIERAMEEATEAYERVLAPLAKFEKAADKAEFEREREATRAEAEKAVIAADAFEGVLHHLGPTVEAEAEAEFKLGRDREAKPANFREVSDTLSRFIAENNEDNLNLVRRDKFVGDVKKGINKFKATKAEYKRCVIAEIERAEAKRAETYVLASNNTVTITSGTVGRNVYGGYIVNNGTATGNTVTISGGKVKGNVFGGYVGGNGEATYNTINITASELSSPEFSTATILCGGICDPETKSNAVTGNTLNIETKGIEVKGISNFEKYKFNLKDIKAGETILTATSGGCSWNTREHNYTSDCAVDISRSNMNISLHTQGVINKGDQCTLIKSPHGFEGKVETEQFDFENEGLLIKYYWDIKIADNKQELIAILADKKIRDEGVSRSLSEGYGSGVVCVNNGMDCIFSKMEETEKLSFEEQSSKSLLGLQRKGEIGAFGGLAASKSKYDIDKGSHIDMIGTSMMGGVGVRVEVGRKEQSSKEQSSKEQSSKKLSSKEQSSKEQNPSEQSSEQSSPELSSKKPSSKKHSSKELGSELTVGVFAEHGTGNSDIHCEKKSKGTSSYTGGGLLGRYNIYEDEFSGTKGQSPKLYGEAILRAGQVENNFDSKKMKDGKGKEYKYKYADAMYGGCAVGGGYKHKVSEKIDLDWSLRYMFGRQWEKDVKREDADGNRMKFKNVTSNRIRIGVRGKYVELEKIKPYAGIGCECELDGKVKGTIQNGVDIIGIPASDFGGVTGIGELGVSGKVWKFGVDISGQGYLGVRKGFGGMLKLKYAFGKDAHGSLASSKASSKAPRSKAPRSKAWDLVPNLVPEA